VVVLGALVVVGVVASVVADVGGAVECLDVVESVLGGLLDGAEL
jgi:hypothetical protein